MAETDNEENGWETLAKLAMGAGAAYGAYKLYQHLQDSQDNDPDSLERRAYKILQKDTNPFSIDDERKKEEAGAMLAKARILREHREMERQGFPIDKDMEAATLKLAGLNFTGGYGQATNDQIADAVGTLYQSAKRTAAELGHKIFPDQKIQCPICSGRGNYICHGCHGTGKNRMVPYPQFTGIETIDAVKSAQYQLDSVCPSCNGVGKIKCVHC